MKYGEDINNDLNSKVKLNLVTPVQLTEVLERHTTREALVRTVKSNIQAACRSQAIMLRLVATAYHSYAYLPMKIGLMDNEITRGYYELSNNIPIEMSES